MAQQYRKHTPQASLPLMNGQPRDGLKHAALAVSHVFLEFLRVGGGVERAGWVVGATLVTNLFHQLFVVQVIVWYEKNFLM